MLSSEEASEISSSPSGFLIHSSTERLSSVPERSVFTATVSDFPKLDPWAVNASVLSAVSSVVPDAPDASSAA